VDITEVRIKLMEDPHDRLQAFCSITFDGCFVVRDLKIIQGTKGPFVAMPSRKLTDRCPCCNNKNHVRSQHCNQCGAKLNENRAPCGENGRAKLYADIAHPINSSCRELIQDRVLDAYGEELVRSKEPGYNCRYDDYGEENYATLDEVSETNQTPETTEAPVETTEAPAAEVPVVEIPTAEAPIIARTESGEAHRIEPAAQGPGGPHHRPQSAPRDQAPNLRDTAGTTDGFGEGLG
jgi:stage V sporulation protein G